MATCLRELRVQSYLVVPTTRDAPFAVTIERCAQREGDDLWAVRFKGMTLNAEGEWEYEPIPSSRDEDYIRRCRFATLSGALAAWNASDKGGR
jgi:hypothetical protein